MKLIVCFICALVTNTTIHSQNSEKSYASFFSMKPDTILDLESNLDIEKNLLKKDAFFSFHNLSYTQNDSNPGIYINTEELNKKVLSNLTIIENTYIDYTEYLRGCGPLKDGITNTVNSGELMLSNIIDNFVNNYLLKNLIFKD